MRNLFYSSRRSAAFIVLFALGWTATTSPAAGQEVVLPPKPRVSPMAAAQVMLDKGTFVRIIYGSPRRQDPKATDKKERVIFGQLVPYGQVWRLGANEATMLVSTGDLEFGGKKLPAGVYSLYAIPEKDKWTLIVNKSVGQWGTQYDETQDLLRIETPVTPTQEVHEAFAISFDKPDEQKSGSAMNMMWENTKVTVPIKVL